MKLILRDDIRAALSSKSDLFDQIMNLSGKVYRKVSKRETVQVDLQGKSFFIKKHFGVGWKEIFKSLFQGKLPVLGAENEWRAIRHLKNSGVDVPIVVGYGKRGNNPAYQESFIITETLENKKSVNDLLLEWRSSQINVFLKRILIKRIAKIVSRMHQSGLNHRDCYLLHFLIDFDFSEKDGNDFPITIIDLHRAQIRSKTPRRWIIKDLGGLFFSSKNIQLTRNDCFRFMKFYSGKSLHVILKEDKQFWQSVKAQAEKLYQKRAIQ